MNKQEKDYKKNNILSNNDNTSLANKKENKLETSSHMNEVSIKDIVLHTKKISLKDADRVLLSLQVIGQIKEYDKLKFSNDDGISIDQDNLQCLWRWVYSEGRDKTISRLNCILQDAYTVVELLISEELNRQIENKQSIVTLDENLPSLLQRLLIAMYCASSGLERLRITYMVDVGARTKLVHMSDSLKAKIDIVKKYVTISDS